MPSLDPNASHALVCLRYGIGDVVMELPVLRALRRALPRARITAVGAFPATQLLDGTGVVDATADFREWGLTHRWDHGSPESRRALRAWVRERGFDLVLDAHHAPPGMDLIFREMGMRVLESDADAEAAAVNAGENGTMAIMRAAHAGWGLEAKPLSLPWLLPLRGHIAEAEEFMEERGLEGAAPFAISPVASLGLKLWPLENLAGVMDRLMEVSPEPLFLFRGPQRSIGRELLARVRQPGRVVTVGPLHLMVIAALLTRCRGLLSNDTGLMHIAAAAGVPTLGVFGPTRPEIYRPPGAHVLTAEPEAVDCPHRETSSLHPPACFVERSCLLGHGGCIRATSMEQVWTRLVELLQLGRCTRPLQLPLERARAAQLGAGSRQAPRRRPQPIG